MHSPLRLQNPNFEADPQNPDDLKKHAQIIEKLREITIRLATIGTKNCLSPSQIAFIDQRLREAFPVSHSPTHPTYASMILEAIAELNEEDGSSENSISKYIVSNFEDLPWAHRRYLSHHLNKLYRDGELVITASRRYTTPGFVADRRKRRGGGKRIGDHENLVKRRENQSDLSEDVVGERQVKRRRRSLIVLKEGEKTKRC